MKRFSCPRALTMLAGAAILLGIALPGGIFPAFAREAENDPNDAIHERWHRFAADLASASGCAVRYEPPARRVDGGEAFAASLTAELGGVGMLRIGASDGPSVLVFPEGFLRTGSVSAAYVQAGLNEPRRFAQEVVATSVAVDTGIDSAGADGKPRLAELLREGSVLIPVFMQHGLRAELHGRAFAGSPGRNFPVRWEAAAHGAPKAAGPYPASHPSVRAMTGWLSGAADLAGVILVGEDVSTAHSKSPFPAGTLEAYCDEKLRLEVLQAAHDGCHAAILKALSESPRLELSEPVWTRLGSTNWSLEVTVSRHGQGRTLGGTVVLGVEPMGGEVVLTAAAASTMVATRFGSKSEEAAEGTPPAMELLPLRNQGLLLEEMAPGTSQQLRLFFTESIQDGSLGQDSVPSLEDASTPSVDLEVTAPRARKATLRSKSPV